MDVYRPSAGAETTFQGKEKPTILFVFGGGFIMGERSGAWYKPWFRTLNDNGYSVVTIDYRLGMKDYPVKKGLLGLLNAANRFYYSQQVGVEDVFSAVSYLAANDIGIDASNLVIAGASAGAIIALASEYEITSGNTEGLPEGFNFKGVISFSGAIIGSKGAPHFKKAPCPVLLMHGTADKAVRYNSLSFFGKGMWGSSWLANSWAQKGYDNFCIYRYKDATHDVAGYMSYVWDTQKEFLEQNVILEKPRRIDCLVDDASLPRWGTISTDAIYSGEVKL